MDYDSSRCDDDGDGQCDHDIYHWIYWGLIVGIRLDIRYVNRWNIDV